jgi:integrase/recombinase XerC
MKPLEQGSDSIQITYSVGNRPELVFDYLDVSEGTRWDYKQRIGQFMRFIDEHGLDTHSFLMFKRYLEDRTDLSVSTKNKYLITARVFLKEMAKHGALPSDITQNVKSFRQTKVHKRDGLSEVEIQSLTAKIKTLPDSPMSSRLKALFCLLALQGLRQIEIVRLDVGDIDLKNRVAMVRGKGKDDKEPVMLHPETVHQVKNYLKANRIADGALFKSMGNRFSSRIGTVTVQREIKKLLNELGIEKTTHGFRHYYITTLLKKLDVRDVRKFSRHRNLEMLVVYDDELDMSHKAVEVFKCFDQVSLGV